VASQAAVRPTVRVWDLFVRAFHWSLALSFAVAWASGGGPEGLHTAAGYVAGALVVTRIVWGFAGSRYARFAQFVRPAPAVVGYLKAIAAGTERRYVGHNPAGGVMIVVLLAGLAATAASGWLLTTDAFWGSPGMQQLHALLADGLLALVLAHLAGVALASLRHRENLVRAMLTGLKRAAGPDDVA
jgi:cytochrome b